MRVDQLMTQPVVTCGIDQPANVAAGLMWEHDCGAVPVVDDHGRAVGIITDRDICMAAYTQGKPLHEIAVAGSMAKQVISCRPYDPVAVAEKLMGDNQIRRVPVVDEEGKPVGILSMTDLAREAGKASGTRKGGLVSEVVRTIAAVCTPRRRQLRPTS